MNSTETPSGFPRTISRETMAALPIRRYEGEVVLVENHRALVRAADDIGHESVVGWDTETRPAFRKGEVYLPSLVQVATSRAVYVFQLKAIDASAVVSSINRGCRGRRPHTAFKGWRAVFRRSF